MGVLLIQLTWAISNRKLLMMVVNITLSQESVYSQPAKGEGDHAGA